jgi:hypothetical protein
MPEIVGRMPPTGKPKLLDRVGDDDAASALVRALRCNLTFVTFLTL